MPANGDPAHRFTPPLTRQTHKHAAPNGFCLECSTPIEPWEGQAGARTYLFAAREVGDALARVAQGSSYRAAAAAARASADRVKQANPRQRTAPAGPIGRRRRRKRRDRVAQDDGQLVANWVDVFTPVICDGLLPTSWPDVLVVDSVGFVRGSQGGRRFNVLGAAGIEQMPEPGRRRPTLAWSLQPFARKTQAAWEEFLASLDGTPKVIVSDADRSIAGAIKAVFPRAGDAAPQHRLSEHHVKAQLQNALPAGLLGTPHPIAQTFDRALLDAKRWAEFVEACENEAAARPRPMVGVMRWFSNYGELVEAQVATRRPELPNSTGACDAMLRLVGERLGDRSSSFTNRARMEKLLTLLTADLRKQANGRVWADRIRERIYLAGGTARFQRQHDDPKGTYSLLS